mgnify:CR=1 FL=1
MSAAARAVAGEVDFRKEEDDGKQEEKALRHRCRPAAAGTGCGVGTWAWLQATDQVTNEFTVGSIGKPEVKPDPDHPDKPGTDPTDPSVDGYLFETKWVKDSKMIPNTDINKNPNVGIGKDSDKSYVFIYVKNAIVKDGEGALAKTPYFNLKNGWEPVAADQVKTNGNEGQYVSGLFMYTAGGTRHSCSAYPR